MDPERLGALEDEALPGKARPDEKKAFTSEGVVRVSVWVAWPFGHGCVNSFIPHPLDKINAEWIHPCGI